MVLYLCVRIRAGGDAIPRLGRGHPPAANPTPFLTISKKAEGGAGEAAKKLKGTGVGLLRLYNLPKSLHQALLKSEGFLQTFLQIVGGPRRYAYTEQVVVLETLIPPAPPHSSLTPFARAAAVLSGELGCFVGVGGHSVKITRPSFTSSFL